MNTLAWNCRGTCARGFGSLVKDTSKEYETSLMFLLETHSYKDSTNRIIPKLGFNNHFIQDGQGQSGGIWCL